MERARWLLQNTDLDVTEVAFECGFHDNTHFARVVRRLLGTTPSDVRAAGKMAKVTMRGTKAAANL
jgi:transcriptional regulator GlxA family with amidase domain